MLAHYAQPCGRHSLVCGLVECALGARGRRSSQRSVGLPSACHKILFLARGSRTLLLRQYTGWEVSSCTSPRSNSCLHELIQDVSRASNTNLVGCWLLVDECRGTACHFGPKLAQSMSRCHVHQVVVCAPTASGRAGPIAPGFTAGFLAFSLALWIQQRVRPVGGGLRIGSQPECHVLVGNTLRTARAISTPAFRHGCRAWWPSYSLVFSRAG